MNTNQQSLREWKVGLKAFGVDTNQKLLMMVKKVAFEIYKRVLMKTPVDKGFLRGAWTLSFGQPSDENTRKSLSGTVPNRSSQFNEGAARIAAMNAIDTVWLSNAMPYVETVEFGGYPNPPKKPTGKTVAGFSKQAPRGMLGISILEVVNWIKQQASKAQGDTEI